MNFANLAPADRTALEKIGEMIRDIDIALMVTYDEQGNLHARPMSTQKGPSNGTFTGDIWFMTDANSPKVREIWFNRRVLLNYADLKQQNYVTIAGSAEIVRDQKKVKALWHESLKTWFPKGPDDPQIVLIHVTVEAAEYWDSPSQKIMHAFGYFKSHLTGERPQMGEHKRINNVNT